MKKGEAEVTRTFPTHCFKNDKAIVCEQGNKIFPSCLNYILEKNCFIVIFVKMIPA